MNKEYLAQVLGQLPAVVDMLEHVNLKKQLYLSNDDDSRIYVFGSGYSSLGITSLLTNYHRLSKRQKKHILEGTQNRDKAAWSRVVKPGSDWWDVCVRIGKARQYTTEHEKLQMYTQMLAEAWLLPLRCTTDDLGLEFTVGLQNYIVQTSPESDKQCHPVGAIDNLLFDMTNGRLALLEVKTAKYARVKSIGASEDAAKSFLREKTLLQLWYYAKLLEIMMIEHDSNLDIQMEKHFIGYILGHDERTKTLTLYQVNFEKMFNKQKHWPSINLIPIEK